MRTPRPPRRRDRSSRLPARLERLEDRRVPATFTVTTVADSGPGSLRDAIEQSNLQPGTDRIDFNIPGPGPHRIAPQTALPTMTGPVILDGYTQPGSSPNTLAIGDDAVRLIELDVDIPRSGLRLEGGQSVVRGLAIMGFSFGGIVLDELGGNLVEGNMVGLDRTGTFLDGSGDAISVFGGSGNVIGGTAPAARNVIMGHAGYGIRLDGGPTGEGGHLVQGNYIGVQRSGLARAADPLGGSATTFIGISVMSTSGNTIGGTTPGAGNLISGANGNGISLWYAGLGNALPASRNLVQGNFIGTDATGTAPLGNIGGIVDYGQANTIGGTASGAGNVLSANDKYGLVVGDVAVGSVVEGNFIGTDATGTSLLPNGEGAIYIEALPPAVAIGGTAPGAGNVIGFADKPGIVLTRPTMGWPSTSRPHALLTLLSNTILSEPGPIIARHNQGPPIPTLLSAETSADGTTIQGELTGLPDASYTIEFHAVSTASGPPALRTLRAIGTATATTDSSGKATFTASLDATLPPGSSIAATAINPDRDTSDLSATIPVAVAVVPPSSPVVNPPPVPVPVPSVASLLRAGGPRQRARIALGFNDDLDPTPAATRRSYRLVWSGRDGQLGTADDRALRLRKASYDADTHTVTLTPRLRRLPARFAYRVTVTGALTARDGTPLDGDNDGNPGGQYVGTLPARAARGMRSPRRS